MGSWYTGFAEFHEPPFPGAMDTQGLRAFLGDPNQGGGRGDRAVPWFREEAFRIQTGSLF